MPAVKGLGRKPKAGTGRQSHKAAARVISKTKVSSAAAPAHRKPRQSAPASSSSALVQRGDVEKAMEAARTAAEELTKAAARLGAAQAR